MNITINSQILAQELRLVAKVAPTKAPLAVLNNIRITAKDDKAYFSATDLEIALLTDCPATVIVPGGITVPAAKFLSLVEQFPDAPVAITLDKKQVKVTCGAYTSRLQTFGVEDFPQTPEVAGTECRMEARTLHGLIEKTRYAVNEGSAKTLLQGALLNMRSPQVSMVSTDGKRLAIATDDYEGPEYRIVLPVKTLDTILTQTTAGEVIITIGDRHTFFQFGNRLVVSRQIEGEFPKFERVIPTDNTLSAEIGRLALTAALRRVGLSAGEDGAVHLSFDAGTVTLKAASSAVGEAVEQVLIAYAQQPITVTCNWEYLLDFLNAANQIAIRLSLKNHLSPIIATDGERHMAVIMAMAGA